MTEYRIHPLVVGANETDQGIMTYLKGYGKRIWIPIYVFYLEGGPEKILVDTGLEQFMVPEEVAEQYGLKIQEFEDALATYDLAPEDIDIIIHTGDSDFPGIEPVVSLKSQDGRCNHPFELVGTTQGDSHWRCRQRIQNHIIFSCSARFICT